MIFSWQGIIFLSRNHFVLSTEELFFLTSISLPFKGIIFSCKESFFPVKESFFLGIEDFFPGYRGFFSSQGQGFLYPLKDFSLKWIFSQLWFSWQVILSLKRNYYPYKELFFLTRNWLSWYGLIFSYQGMYWKRYLIRNTNCKFD